MPYYEHEGKQYTLDQLCDLGIVIAIRMYTRIYTSGQQGEPAYYADSDDLAGWEIPENTAIYLAGKYFDKIEVV